MKFRTRSYTIDAIQWTGNNREEVKTWMSEQYPHCPWEISDYLITWPDGRARIGDWLIKRGAAYPSAQTKLVSLVPYEPIPTLIRTAEQYESLPEGTILEIIADHNHLTLRPGDVVKLGHNVRAEGLHRRGVICRVVETGSTN